MSRLSEAAWFYGYWLRVVRWRRNEAGNYYPRTTTAYQRAAKKSLRRLRRLLKEASYSERRAAGAFIRLALIPIENLE